jgi:hypothetical protein
MRATFAEVCLRDVEVLDRPWLANCRHLHSYKATYPQESLGWKTSRPLNHRSVPGKVGLLWSSCLLFCGYTMRNSVEQQVQCDAQRLEGNKKCAGSVVLGLIRSWPPRIRTHMTPDSTSWKPSNVKLTPSVRAIPKRHSSPGWPRELLAAMRVCEARIVVVRFVLKLAQRLPLSDVARSQSQRALGNRAAIARQLAARCCIPPAPRVLNQTLTIIPNVDRSNTFGCTICVERCC